MIHYLLRRRAKSDRSDAVAGFLLADSMITTVVGSLLILALLSVMATMCCQWQRVHIYEQVLQRTVTMVEGKKRDFQQGTSLQALQETVKQDGITIEITPSQRMVEGILLPVLEVRSAFVGHTVCTYVIYLYEGSAS